MKRLILMFIALSSLLLCSCGSKSESSEPAFSMTNSNGDIINLYMPREEAIKILGETNPNQIGMYEYDTITIGFTHDEVSYISSSSNEWSLADGNTAGNKINYPNQYPNQYVSADNMIYLKYFKKNNEKYTTIAKDNLPKKLISDDFKAFQCIEIHAKNDDVSSIFIYDSYVAHTAFFD